MISNRYPPVLFGFLMSGTMACIVSGMSNDRSIGIGHTFDSVWMANRAVS